MPTRSIHVRELPVEADDAHRFLEALDLVISNLAEMQAYSLYMVVQARRAIAISFSGELKPFLGFTAGFNPEDTRVYLPRGLRFLELIGEALNDRELEIPGGRVFIRKFDASKVIENREATLCVYDWPGEDPVRLALHMLINKLRALGEKYMSLTEPEE